MHGAGGSVPGFPDLGAESAAVGDRESLFARTCDAVGCWLVGQAISAGVLGEEGRGTAPVVGGRPSESAAVVKPRRVRVRRRLPYMRSNCGTCASRYIVDLNVVLGGGFSHDPADVLDHLPLNEIVIARNRASSRGRSNPSPATLSMARSTSGPALVSVRRVRTWSRSAALSCQARLAGRQPEGVRGREEELGVARWRASGRCFRRCVDAVIGRAGRGVRSRGGCRRVRVGELGQVGIECLREPHQETRPCVLAGSLFEFLDQINRNLGPFGEFLLCEAAVLAEVAKPSAYDARFPRPMCPLCGSLLW